MRWSDVDTYGHVNNVVFFDYVAEARIALKEPLLDNAITGRGAEVEHTWMVARQDLRYLAQMQHRLAPYEVRTAIGRLGRTSMTLAAEVVDPEGGAVLARSTTVLVHGDADGRPQPLPDELHDAARRWAAIGAEGLA
ncbi:acyl-CoA thioesterase [Propioniciclava coleopterorum]|uniref:Acyl-CoA thioesterase n=1 Tax=Propioniciclava coleopterorum TaxID=2714937 RepID=A0A6G7Y2Y2_9ACTN|nr:thioesterase family protein [Propioniciclava coleopterorum]QIK71190.1 acyl-CoA thioesterase [Propioniciclava coleopterorum]